MTSTAIIGLITTFLPLVMGLVKSVEARFKSGATKKASVLTSVKKLYTSAQAKAAKKTVVGQLPWESVAGVFEMVNDAVVAGFNRDGTFAHKAAAAAPAAAKKGKGWKS